MELTRLPHRDVICSRDVTIPFATALESNGSNFAASSSFATVLPIAMPSAIPGGLRMPPENTWPIASLTRLEHRVRKEVSNTESDRRTRIVSGLWILSAKSRGERSQLPLMGLGVYRIRVHSNLREELVDQTQELWIIGAEGCLQKRGGCALLGGARNTFVKFGYLLMRLLRIYRGSGPGRSKTLLWGYFLGAFPLRYCDFQKT